MIAHAPHCRFRVIGLLALCAIFCSQRSGEGAYPESYLAGRFEARVFSESKLTGPFTPDALLSDDAISKGRFAFAPVEQRRTFTVDLGRARTFDRIQIGTGGNCDRLIVEISSRGLKGPFEKILVMRDPVFFQILRVPLSTARWVRFDLGDGSNRVGVHSVRIYKGYEHPNLPDVTRLLHERIKPDIAALASFRKYADAGDWPNACRQLRAYFASTHKPEAPPHPDYDLTRANKIVTGELDFAGLARNNPPPIDWAWMKTTDWYEHKNFLNRGSAVGVLTDAAYHTGSEIWTARFREVFYDWVNENPKPDVMRGPDYPTWRTLDTAARLSWMVSRFAEVTAAKKVDDELWANYLHSIWEHVDYLKNDDFSGGNWLATITSSVTDAARQFGEFADHRVWLEYGKTGFERNVMRDVYPDGKEMEDAPGYICMAYKAMLATLKLLEAEGIQTTPEVRQRLDRVQDFLAAVTAPDGIMPSIGDWGGCEPYALPAAAEYFDRDDIRYVLSKGRTGVPPSMSSINFPHGGWTIMRTPYTKRPYENARHLVFKSSMGPHGHLDVLSVTAYAFGRKLLIDPGIRSYERDDVQRYLQTAYHNTVCIDKQNQPRRAGKTDAWFSNSAIDYVSALYHGYPNLSHRRSILFVKPYYWLVRDRITGTGAHTYDQNWHFAADAAASMDKATKQIRTNYHSGGNILIAPADGSEYSCEPFDFFIAEKRMTTAKENIPAKGFRYSTHRQPPAAFDVVLYPYQDRRAPLLSVEILTNEKSEDMTGLKVTADNNIDYIFITNPGSGRRDFVDETIAIDAEILLIRTSAGKVRSLAGRNVCRVVFRGDALLDRKEPIADLTRDLP